MLKGKLSQFWLNGKPLKGNLLWCKGAFDLTYKEYCYGILKYSCTTSRRTVVLN